MKKIILLTLLILSMANHCFSQEIGNRKLIGGSFNYSHDDKNNNRLLSNYFHYEKNYTNSFQFSGEFVSFINENRMLGIEFGYNFSNSILERKISESNTDYTNSQSSGFSFLPKYRVIKSISDHFWLYSDFKFKAQFSSLTNSFSQLSPYSNNYEDIKMNGNEQVYGISISPGLVYMLNKKIGVKVDYSIFNLNYSNIKEAKNSDRSFENINSWDYDFNLNLSQLNLGIILML